VLTVPAGVRIYLACGVTDMRKGFDSLAITDHGARTIKTRRRSNRALNSFVPSQACCGR